MPTILNFFVCRRADTGNTVTAQQIESGASKLVAEFAAMGIDLVALLKDTKKQRFFMYNEFGMGGGLSECGDVPGMKRG